MKLLLQMMILTNNKIKYKIKTIWKLKKIMLEI